MEIGRPFNLSSATNPGSDGFVRSFARGLAVIHALGNSDGTHAVADVAALTGLPRTVVRRILLTLCELGYAVESESRGFRLTPKILTLGMSYLTSLPFWGHAQRALETLWTQVIESCAMCVLDGRDAVFVLRIPSLKIMSLNLGVGNHVPAFATAPGRAILGFQAADFLLRFLDEVPLHAYTAHTVCDKSALLECFAVVRRDGYAWVDGEFDEYIAGLAVPVRDERLNVVASISINLPSGEMTHEEAIKKYLPALRAAAHQLTGLRRPSSMA